MAGIPDALDLTPVDYDPFAAEKFANPTVKAVLGDLASLPKRAIDASAQDVQHLGESGYTPTAIGPAVETALNMIGGAGVVPAEANTLRSGIKAYHGSPHDFDKFSMDKIGTGEGAQAYGHGMYFAENEAVAKSYREALAGSSVDGKQFNPANPLHQAAARIDEHGNRAAAIAEVERRIAHDPGDEMNPRVLAMLLHRPEIPPIKPAGGKMYEVNINADSAHFLDWDKPLAADHPLRQKIAESAQAALDRATTGANRNIAKDALFHASNGNLTGQGAYQQLARTNTRPGIIPDINISQPAKASEILKDAGIPGIKYLDQGSRGTGEGSRNYVVFDDNLVNIIKKYGMAGVSMLPPAAAAFLSQRVKPVDHNPFAIGGTHAMTPVDHDPFTPDEKS